MNTRKDRAKFKNFRILLYSGFSSTIIMKRLRTKLNPKRDAVMQWYTQGGNITTNIRLKNIFYLT